MRKPTGTPVLAPLFAAAVSSWALAQIAPVPAAAPPLRVSVAPRRGLPGRDVALLVSGQQGGQIAVSIKVFPAGSAGGTDRIPWVLDIPGPSLESMATDGSLDLELAVCLLRKGGDVVGHEEDTLHVTGVPAAWQSGGGLKLLGYVDTTAPPALLRVLVREPSSGAFGNWEMPVPTRASTAPRTVDFGLAEVTDAGGGQGGMVGTGFEGMMSSSGLLALVVPEPPESWFVVGLGGAAADAKGAPFSLAGGDAAPATRPVVRPGAVLKVSLLGEGLPGRLEARARVIYSGGRPPVTCPARILRRLPAPAGPFERLDVAVTLPSEIPPGEHGLIVSCRPIGGLDAGSVGTQFRVAPAEKSAAALTWPAVSIDESGMFVAPARPDVGIRPSREEAPPQLKAAYREAVAAYAADSSFPSLRALVKFERSALAGGSAVEMGRLASAERSLARSVSKTSPDALLGLCLVQLDVYREHSRDAAYLAIGQSRRAIDEATELLAAAGPAAERRRAAAAVFTVFAAELQAVGSLGSADRLFARAVELDPSDVAALLGRAAILERVGDARHAITLLEQILSLQPNHAEAELRLGVDLRRIRHDGAARKALTGCTTQDRPAWVQAVAWQELAAMELADGNPRAALAILRRATAALPTDEGLAVLLASTLDRERRFQEALAVVNATLDHPAADVTSARLLYAQPPHDDVDAVRARLAKARARSLAALTAAVQEERL